MLGEVTRRFTAIRTLVPVTAAALLLLAGPSSAHAATCAGATTSGGDWPMYGHDLANTRDQPAEHQIGPQQAATLEPLWSFYEGKLSGPFGANLSDFNATPTVAGGCVYVGSGQHSPDTPNLFALNADTGELVWSASLEARATGQGGAVVGSLTVRSKRLFVLVNEQANGTDRDQGPYAVALNRRNGSILWRSDPFLTEPGYYTNATPTVADGVVVAGFSASEGDPWGHGGVALLNARTGALMKISYTVPRRDWGTEQEPLYAGGGVWTAPAVDDRGYAYYGTGNPYSKKTEHQNTNAILKLDIDRSRRTFGRIVGSTHGNIDQYLELVKTLSRPTCEVLPDSPFRTLPSLGDPTADQFKLILSNSIGCAQLDLGFGAAPNLFTGPDGRAVVGVLQKSGVYHAVRTAGMSPVYSSALGVPCIPCNAASPAYAGGRIFNVTTPGLVTGIDSVSGDLEWAGLIADAIHFQSVSTANDVVYTTDGLGFFNAFDASNGELLLKRHLLVDTNGGLDAIPPSGFASNGIAIARHTVYIEFGSHVVAYQPTSPAS